MYRNDFIYFGNSGDYRFNFWRIKMKYEVPIIYRGQVNYIVEANSPEDARQKADERFKKGEPANILGNEWEEVEEFGEILELPNNNKEIANET